MPESEEDFAKEYTDGRITWVYDGMAEVHRGDGDSADGFAFNTADLPASFGDATAMVSETVRIDEQGRRWVPSDVQRSDIVDALYDYADRIKEDLGIVEDGDIEAGIDGLDPAQQEAGENVWVNQDWWDFDDHNCTDEERHSFGTDDNTSVSSPMTSDQRKAVIVYVDQDMDGDFDGSCSGTLVDRRWVLTAGHCLVDDENNPTSALLPRFLTVCSYGNAQSNAECTTGSILQLGPDYLASPGPPTDFGLLKIATELNSSTDLGFRAISTATDATIEAATVKITGSPGRHMSGTDHCASNDTSAQVTSITAGGTTWAITFAETPREDSVAGTAVMTSTLLTDNMDLGHGWSGAGYWFINGSGADMLVGIHVAFTTVADWGADSWGYFDGAKADTFRSWVNSTI